jgi:hypothetical protein
MCEATHLPGDIVTEAIVAVVRNIFLNTRRLQDVADDLPSDLGETVRALIGTVIRYGGRHTHLLEIIPVLAALHEKHLAGVPGADVVGIVNLYRGTEGCDNACISTFVKTWLSGTNDVIGDEESRHFITGLI